MRRAALALLTATAAVACRPYDSYTPVVSQDGLVPAATFARYGREQAVAVAIGRSFAEHRMTDDAEGLAGQARAAECYARRFPGVTSVVADPQGHRLTVQFQSGWRVGILPIPDGVAPDSTPGLPPRLASPCKA
jgi:hypothetical protein